MLRFVAEHPHRQQGTDAATEGGEEQIELLQLDKAGIKVAKYLTELPSREVLQRQIQKSLEAAKARFENFIDDDAVEEDVNK